MKTDFGPYDLEMIFRRIADSSINEQRMIGVYSGSDEDGKSIALLTISLWVSGQPRTFIHDRHDG